ncbi:hypothetical protein K474DRAFT_1657028 [Panus rudis PR-1116 ss-1]|nr:hypothetical protein K474DRAFT_1657028 [Panus rudis PR-1116 ss-1]
MACAPRFLPCTSLEPGWHAPLYLSPRWVTKGGKPAIIHAMQTGTLPPGSPWRFDYVGLLERSATVSDPSDIRSFSHKLIFLGAYQSPLNTPITRFGSVFRAFTPH